MRVASDGSARAAWAGGTALASWPRRVAVAIDGWSGATPAVVVARRFQRRGATIEALDSGWSAPNESGRRPRAAFDVASLADATERAADLVVLGLGPAPHRICGDVSRIAPRLARFTPVPLYAAITEDVAPERCLVVLPDGGWHGTTMRRAIACTRPGGSVWIVTPESSPRVSHALAGRVVNGIRLEHARLRGEFLSATLYFAADVGAQLIAIPISGEPGGQRASLPNLAEPLLLTTPCSVLVVPSDGTLPHMGRQNAHTATARRRLTEDSSRPMLPV